MYEDWVYIAKSDSLKAWSDKFEKGTYRGRFGNWISKNIKTIRKGGKPFIVEKIK